MDDAPLIGKSRWIERKTYVLGGSKRKTKRREQRQVRFQIREDTETMDETDTQVTSIKTKIQEISDRLCRAGFTGEEVAEAFNSYLGDLGLCFSFVDGVLVADVDEETRQRLDEEDGKREERDA